MSVPVRPTDDVSARSRPLPTARPVPSGARRPRLRPGALTPWLYLAPGVLVYALFAFLPLLHTAWLSLFEWDGITVGEWVGLDNYVTTVQNDDIRRAFGHSLVLVFFFAIVPTVIGLVTSALMARSIRRGLTVYRTLLFLPQAIATVVTAVAWRSIYLDEGPLSGALRAVGLGGLVPDAGWLGDPNTALVALGLVGTWIMTGLCTVLFLAGVQSIPTELYDAARVDGAGTVREFFAVTLPSLQGEVAFALAITTIAALRSFDLVYVATGGGPDNATRVPAISLFQQAFQNGQVGSAAAVAVLLTALIFVVTAGIARLQPQRGER